MKCYPILFGLIAMAIADGQIEFFGGEYCGGSASVQTVPGDGACRQLGGIKSAEPLSVDPNCSFTVYTDPNCSDGATAPGLGQCATIGTNLLSFSYDC